MSQAVLAVIVGNRDFFPDRLVAEGRQDILALFKKMSIEPVILSEKDTNLGGVETWQDAKKCADLFKADSEKIDGILVLLPNFGDERGVAETIKLSGSGRSDPGAGLSGRPRQLHRRAPSRRLVRQDLRLQQSAAVRLSVLPHDRPHGSAGLGAVPGGPGAVRRRLPGGSRSA